MAELATDAGIAGLGVAVVAPLLELGRADPDPSVRLAALEALAHFPLDAQAEARLTDAIEALVRTTSPRSVTHRLAVALAARLRATPHATARTGGGLSAGPPDPFAADQIQAMVHQIRQAHRRRERLILLERLGVAGDRLSEFGHPGRSGATPPDEATSLPRPTRSAPARRSLPHAPTVPEARRVQVQLLHGGQQRQTFLAEAAHVIRCWIGPPQADSAAADQPIPDTTLPEDGLLLQAQLHWRDRHGHQHDDSRPLLLPAERDARSSDCHLRLEVPEGERFVSADLLLRYRGRVFEAVKIEAFVLTAEQAETQAHTVEVLVQNQLREVIDLADSPPADATLVLDPPRSGHPASDPGANLVLFDEHGARAIDLGDPSLALRHINAALHGTEKIVARKPGELDELDDDDPDVLSLLRTLARHGANFYNLLRDGGLRDPGERIQVLNRTRVPVPLEFVYDRGVPTDDARLCTGWREALRSDAVTCPVCSRVPLTEDQRDGVEVLCPLGFWSLQKVIERIEPDIDRSRSHDHDRDRDGGGPGASVPTARRRQLRPIDSALFACSDKVPEPERTRLWEALGRCVRQPVQATDWVQWKEKVKDDPALLLVLPHHDVDQGLDFLEIGASARLGREQLSPLHINPDHAEPGPIVLMLGCQTATDTDDPTGQIELTRRVQQQHASIVLGTLAKVLGRHAAPVAQELVEQLAAAHDADTDFGTVLRRVRRRMLGRGHLMALCLVALGDAQWRLAPTAAGPR